MSPQPAPHHTNSTDGNQGHSSQCVPRENGRGTPEPHPFSEEADAARLARENPGRAARAIRIWTLVAAVVWVLIAFAFCSARAEAQTFHWMGRETNADGCLEIWTSRGGSIAEAEALFDSARCIKITGPCMSACTMALGHPDVCWTERASFHFHAGWTRNGWDQAPGDSGTLQMFSSYPTEVRVMLPPLTDWTEAFTVWPAEWTAAVMDRPLC